MGNYRKLLAFVAIGALASATYAVLLVLLVEHLRVPMFVGSVIAFAIAIPVSYFGNRRITYRSRNVLGPEALRFLAAQLANLVITSVIVHVASKTFGFGAYVAVVVALLAAPVVSFVLFELWVYRQRPHRNAGEPSGPGPRP